MLNFISSLRTSDVFIFAILCFCIYFRVHFSPVVLSFGSDVIYFLSFRHSSQIWTIMALLILFLSTLDLFSIMHMYMYGYRKYIHVYELIKIFSFYFIKSWMSGDVTAFVKPIILILSLLFWNTFIFFLLFVLTNLSVFYDEWFNYRNYKIFWLNPTNFYS